VLGPTDIKINILGRELLKRGVARGRHSGSCFGVYQVVGTTEAKKKTGPSAGGVYPWGLTGGGPFKGGSVRLWWVRQRHKKEKWQQPTDFEVLSRTEP